MDKKTYSSVKKEIGDIKKFQNTKGQTKPKSGEEINKLG